MCNNVKLYGWLKGELAIDALDIKWNFCMKISFLYKS